MTEFTGFAKQHPRVTQQMIYPTAVKPAGIAQLNVSNTTSEILGPFSILNNGSLSIRSILTNSNNPNFRLGALPFCITYFQTSLSTANIIGDQITGGYKINIMPMAQFTPLATNSTPGGSDGNNLVIVSELINNTGGTKTIYAITNTRVWTPIGGAAT